VLLPDGAPAQHPKASADGTWSALLPTFVRSFPLNKGNALEVACAYLSGRR